VRQLKEDVKKVVKSKVESMEKEVLSALKEKTKDLPQVQIVIKKPEKPKLPEFKMPPIHKNKFEQADF